MNLFMMDIDCPWAGAVVVAAAPETRELTACWTHFPLSWSGVVINPQKESFTRSFEIVETLLACSEGRLTAGLTRLAPKIVQVSTGGHRSCTLASD